MKILVVTHSYGSNGAAAVLKLAMRHWCQNLGWQVDALVDDKLSLEEAEELRVIGVQAKQEVKIPTDYHLVLINTLIDSHYIGNFAGHLPIVWWIHEGTTTLHNVNFPISTLINLFAKTNLVIFDSEWQATEVFRSFIYHLLRKRFQTAHCGARAADVSIDQSRLGSSSVKVICVGSVYARKRQLDLANALVGLSQRYAVQGTFIGSLAHLSSFGENTESYIRQHTDVLNFTGVITDAEMQKKLSNADIACFPSGDETFNISAMEAANYGLPVILADLRVYDELGWQHGVNCLKYPAGKIDALERELEKLIQDPQLRQQLAKAGKELAEKYTIEAFLERMTSLVLSQKRQIA